MAFQGTCFLALFGKHRSSHEAMGNLVKFLLWRHCALQPPSFLESHGSQPVLTFSSRRYLAMSGNILDCLNWKGVAAVTDIQWVKVSDVAKHPTTHRTIPLPKTIIWSEVLLVPRVRNSAMAPSQWSALFSPFYNKGPQPAPRFNQQWVCVSVCGPASTGHSFTPTHPCWLPDSESTGPRIQPHSCCISCL